MMLADLGWRHIQVLDRLPAPQPSDGANWGKSDRSYNIGISELGQLTLEDLGVMDRVLACATPLQWRHQWTPGKPEGEWTKQGRYSRSRDTVVRSADVAQRRRRRVLRPWCMRPVVR